MGSGAGGIYESTYGRPNELGPSGTSTNGRIRSSGDHSSPKQQPAHGTLEENARSVCDKYSLQTDGFFAEKGNIGGIRVYKSDDQYRDSRDFFDKISAGGKEESKPQIDAYKVLSDGTRISYRKVTKTPDSPAVQIIDSPTSVVVDQKIHFVKGAIP